MAAYLTADAIVLRIGEKRAMEFVGSEVPQTAILFVWDVAVSDLHSQARNRTRAQTSSVVIDFLLCSELLGTGGPLRGPPGGVMPHASAVVLRFGGRRARRIRG